MIRESDDARTALKKTRTAAPLREPPPLGAPAEIRCAPLSPDSWGVVARIQVQSELTWKNTTVRLRPLQCVRRATQVRVDTETQPRPVLYVQRPNVHPL